MQTKTHNRNQKISIAVARILRPLARFLLHFGISYKDFSEIVKRVFLEESSLILKKANTEITSSALSIVSGIHRKDTSSFLKDPTAEPETADTSGGGSGALAVFSEWISNPDYLNLDKKPLPLPYSHSDKNVKTFRALSEKVMKDVRAKTIFDELVRLDLVQYDVDTVTLKQDAFVPQADLNEKLDFFAKNISEHMQAAVTNVQSKTPPYFERSAFQDGLSEEDIKQIDSHVRQKGMDLLIDIFSMAKELAAKDPQDSKSKKGYINLGVFLNHGERNDRNI
jgi:hypothetical protein